MPRAGRFVTLGAALLAGLLASLPLTSGPASATVGAATHGTAPPWVTGGSTAPTPAELSGRVDALVERQMSALHIPGLAIVIIRDGRICVEKGYGTTGSADPVSVDTPFVLGSTSKQLTGLAVQRLAAEGRLDLDQPVRAVLPSFGSGSEQASLITPRMLLGQTSGLSARSSRTAWDTAAGEGDSLQENAKRLGTVALDRLPGTSFEYADANYDLLGAVVEAASGQGFDAYLHSHVLEPLGMTHTFGDLGAARAAGLTDGYYRWFGLWNAAMDLPNARSAVPSSYIVSTARDQAALLMARLGPSPSDRETAAALTASLEPLARVDQWSDYASGWYAHPFWPSLPPGDAGTEPGVPLMYQHSGTAITYRSFLAFSPGAHYGIVVLVNRDDEVTPSGFDIFTDQLTRTALGTELPPYHADEDLLRRYSGALLVGLPLLQLATLLMAARARRRRRFALAVVSAVLVSLLSLSVLLGYVPSQSTLPLVATWQVLPDVASVTAMSVALALLVVVVVGTRVRRRRLSATTETSALGGAA